MVINYHHGRPSLKHQRVQGDQDKDVSALNDWFKRGTQKVSTYDNY